MPYIKKPQSDWLLRGGEPTVVEHSKQFTLLPALEGVKVATTPFSAFSALEGGKEIIT